MNTRSRRAALVRWALALTALALATRPARAEHVVRLSLGPGNAQPNAPCAAPALSADGSCFAFESTATTLVQTNDDNVQSDVFVRGPAGDGLLCASRNPQGNAGNSASFGPSISADGRFVAFTSFADDLVPGDTNGAADVFLFDAITQTMTRISTSATGAQGNADSVLPTLSADGKVVSFRSLATNLVGGDTNARADVFVKVLASGAITRVSVATGGAQGNDHALDCSLSGDARYVAFTSLASNLTNGDTNGAADVFLHDRLDGSTVMLSKTLFGAAANGASSAPRLSHDGGTCAFQTLATNLVSADFDTALDVIVLDTHTKNRRCASMAPGFAANPFEAREPSISADGRYVAFRSVRVAPVPGQGLQPDGPPSIFVYDAHADAVIEVTRGDLFDALPNAPCSQPSLAAGGSRVAFASAANNLAGPDTNGLADVFRANLVRLIPGDHFSTDLEDGEPRKTATFVGLAGTKVRFDVKFKGTGAPPRVSLEDAKGEELGALLAPNGKKKKLQVVLPGDGVFRVRFAIQEPESNFSFQCALKAVLPKAARTRVVKVPASASLDFHELFGTLPGTAVFVEARQTVKEHGITAFQVFGGGMHGPKIDAPTLFLQPAFQPVLQGQLPDLSGGHVLRVATASSDALLDHVIVRIVLTPPQGGLTDIEI